MIVFYAANFELNLTSINIKFIEESAFFFDAFYKNYTTPFVMPLDDETSAKLGLIDIDNITDYTVKHEGKLFIDTDFFDAYLLIEVENETIEGSLYYGQQNLKVFETALKDLPFKTEGAGNIRSFAVNQINKAWPEASCNFPMVYDDEFNSKTNYKDFEGVVNNFDGSAFLSNNIDVEGNVINRNILSPFPYVLEILTVGFGLENKSISGGFVQRKENVHLLLDTKKHLEEFSSNTTDNFQFDAYTDQFLDNGILISEFLKETVITNVGTYKIKISINLPDTFIVKSFKVLQDANVIFESTANAVQTELSINKQDAAGSITIGYILQLEGDVNSVIDYNNISFEKSEGKLNNFKNFFSLAEVMPDMTFGAFLVKLKNWLNLKIEIKNNYVLIDYVEELFDTIDFKNETEFEILHPKRELNQKKRYKLTMSNPDDEIFVDKTGLSTAIDETLEQELKVIETGISIYPIEERNGIFTAVRNEDAEFGILLYNGKDVNNYPVVAQSINGITFSLQEIYGKYWKKWLYFRLNSETYTDKFTAHSLEEFSTLVGRFKYNKKHIIKKISKQRISEEQFLYEIESETF